MLFILRIYHPTLIATVHANPVGISTVVMSLLCSTEDKGRLQCTNLPINVNSYDLRHL